MGPYPSGETITALLVGIGLSAACGFRLLLPFWGVSVAAAHGLITLAPGFGWLATTPAVVALTVAALLEIAAYAFPWVDQLLDLIALPLAVAAGTVVTAAVVDDGSPFLKWSLALIAGGGTAGVVQGATSLLRGLSTLSTGGAGNLLVALAELVGSALFTLLALALPLLALALLALAGLAAAWLWRRCRTPR
jgi:hypothetical protein